ncbi:MAG: YcaO-like family protein [Deltaproteobacteria bacterium]|nr:YcaO-like family protein [Deltaproteobacteria bacterium]
MTAKIELKDAYKGYTQDQDKLIPPEQTIELLKEKLKNIDCDILSYTEQIDNGRIGIPVFLSVCGKDAAAIVKTKKQMGKGATPEQAETSAIMELIERYSLFYFKNNKSNFIFKKYKDITEPRISFDMIADSVTDDRADIEISKEIFENLPFKWTKAYNITTDQEILIPFDWFFAINAFNGASAGNCAEEALIQGISEIIERHTSALVSSNKIKVPAINPDTSTDTKVCEMLAKYKKAGVKLHISDFTLNTGIPTVGIAAWDPSTFPQKSEIVWTAGTAPSPEKALSRALTEVAQLAGDFNTGSNYLASGLPKPGDLTEIDYIIKAGELKSIKQLPDISDNNMKTEIKNLIAALSNKGFNPIAVNTTHPLLKVPAFYTIIPGAFFRERATNSDIGMFCAKYIIENTPPQTAVKILTSIDARLIGKYYIKFYIGSSYLSLGRHQKACDYFEKALTLNPAKQDIASIYSYIGVCLKEMEKYSEALEMLKKGEAEDNNRTDIYNLMGACCFKLKKYKTAINYFKKAIETDPSTAINYANIGSCYRELKNTEKAIKYYHITLEIDPSIEFAAENLLKLMKR